MNNHFIYFLFYVHLVFFTWKISKMFTNFCSNNFITVFKQKSLFVNFSLVIILLVFLKFIFMFLIKDINFFLKDYEGYLDKWNVCSLLLGTGNMFIWFGCLRYLGFFETYNVSLLVLKAKFIKILSKCNMCKYLVNIIVSMTSKSCLIEYKCLILNWCRVNFCNHLFDC